MAKDQMNMKFSNVGEISAVIWIVMMTAASTVAIGLLVYAIGG
jgi:hypothetical protein